MKLIDSQAKIKSIFLDPFNPRFVDPQNFSQEELKKKILSTKESKELLNSMMLDIKWVNKIVVIHKSDFTDKQKNITKTEDCEFLTVEGNSRLACLKSNKISSINEESTIPIIIAQKEPSESLQEFEAQIRVTQGIANVMVVKEWGVVSKAKHLFEMYNDYLNKDHDAKFTPHEIYKKIADELGIGHGEVRQSVMRYEFFNKINELSDRIPEDHWGYLEAIDKTKEIRKKFGMSPENNLINSEGLEDECIEDILKEIPALIKKASSEGINTKQFRDIIQELIKEINGSSDLLEFIQGILSKESEFSFRTHLSAQKGLSEEDIWHKEFDNIKRKIELFPCMAKWASNIKSDLEDISKIIEKHLNVIN
ncbi:MAG: hypothetical protein V1773_10055 [bacterium]